MMPFGLSRIEVYILAGFIAVAAAGGAVIYLIDTGKDIQKGRDATATVKTQERIDDAQANGPRTSGDVDKRLHDGKF